MINFLLLQKMSRVPLKKRFRLVNIISGIWSYILTLSTCKKRCALAIICNLDCRWLAFRHHFRWFPMVIDGFRWLSMVQIYSKSSAHLQLSFPSFAEIFCSTRPDNVIVHNRRKPSITVDNHR